jgi:hypothetical protein
MFNHPHSASRRISDKLASHIAPDTVIDAKSQEKKLREAPLAGQPRIA